VISTAHDEQWELTIGCKNIGEVKNIYIKFSQISGLCDSDTGLFLMSFKMYGGKHEERPPGEPLGDHVVKKEIVFSFFVQERSHSPY
jgi:hypothetical protein